MFNSPPILQVDCDDIGMIIITIGVHNHVHLCPATTADAEAILISARQKWRGYFLPEK